MSNQAKYRTALLYGTLSAVITSAMPVMAQESSKAGLDEIVVTAQRTETDLQKTPISVTAISGDTLAARGTTSLLDVATFTPNLSIGSNSAQGSSGASVSIRGMGVGAPESSASVGIYVDEVYSPSIFGNLLGLLDIDRIEVLRGPQGTLFGRNTIAGAVQYVSVKPSQQFGGFIEATGGNNSRGKVTGAINFPLGDTLAIRLSGLQDYQGGFVTNDFTGKKVGASRITLGRAQARWTPTEALTADLKFEYAHRNDNGRPVAIIGVEPRSFFAGFAQLYGETRPLDNSYLSNKDYHFAGYNDPDFFRATSKTYEATIAYNLTDSITLKSISAYVDNKNHAVDDFDLVPLYLLSADRGYITDTVFTQELQLSGKSFSDQLKWTLGAYYYDGTYESKGQVAFTGLPGFINPFPTPSTGVLPNDDFETSNKSYAVYGQATLNLSEKVSVSAGLRYTKEDVEAINLTLGGTTDDSFNDLSPHFGINYQASDDMMVYAKASKGFRAGGFTVNSNLLFRTDGGVPAIAGSFKPETAWTYEIGARLEFMDKRLRINPTIFYTDWKDIQFQKDIPTFNPATGPNLVGATQNAGDATMKGAEIEAQFAATDRLLLTASLSLMDAEYTRIEDFFVSTYPFGFLASFSGAPGTVVVERNLSLNSPLQQAPEYKYSLGARYTHPLDNDAKLVGNLDWGYTDDYRIGVTDRSSQTFDGYGLLSGRLEYQAPGGKWSLAVFGTNLTDEYYYIGGDGKAKGFTVGTDQGSLGRPREYGVTVKAQF